MSFTCVFIPASPSDPMEEKSFPKITGLEDDSFMASIKATFHNQGVVDAAIFRGNVEDQLKAKGMDVPDEGKMDNIVETLAGFGSVDIFTIAVPGKSNSFQGVSLYSDDKGIAKNLDLNSRAIGFARACNYPDQVRDGRRCNYRVDWPPPVVRVCVAGPLYFSFSLSLYIYTYLARALYHSLPRATHSSADFR